MAIIPTRATLLTTPIGELRDWNLIASCPCRSFPRHLALEKLVVELGTRPTLETILSRLRCEKCGGPAVRVEAKRGDPFAVRVSAVVLLESKAAAGRARG